MLGGGLALLSTGIHGLMGGVSGAAVDAGTGGKDAKKGERQIWKEEGEKKEKKRQKGVGCCAWAAAASTTKQKTKREKEPHKQKTMR